MNTLEQLSFILCLPSHCLDKWDHHNALDQVAMESICRKVLMKIQKTWKEKRDKLVVILYGLVEYIGELSHKEDEKSGFIKGGRIVSTHISRLIESGIQQEVSSNRAAYEVADLIKLV